MKIRGAITIGRHSDQAIHIDIKDEGSGTNFVEITMSPADFATCLTGLYTTDVDVQVRGLEKVGKIREYKTESIPRAHFGNVYEAKPELIREVLSGYEVDGWQARDDDVRNHHNYSRDSVKVIFERWVENLPKKQNQ